MRGARVLEPYLADFNFFIFLCTGSRIDGSSVGRKYIGKTEKNLRKVLDAAKAGKAILFLDKGDAHLGKRSGIKGIRDLYTNTEINYLLQRMKQYRGVAISATNKWRIMNKHSCGEFGILYIFPTRTRESRIAAARCSGRIEMPRMNGIFL